MKKRLAAASITLAAVIVFKLWPQADAATEIAPPPPAPVVSVASAIPEIEPLRDVASMPGAHSIGRNLFGYPEPPPAPVVATPPPVVVAPIAAPEPPRVEAPPQPQTPIFHYRYIGRFGPDSAPIAVFRGDDAIINATVGQVIDGTFVVRAIGMESVSLALASDVGRGEAVRVALGES